MFLICGETLYDVHVERPPSNKVRHVALAAKAGGSPHNVAIGLVRLGCPAMLSTEIANDSLGRFLEAHLISEGVDCRFVRRTATATPLAMVDVDAAGQPRYAFHGLDAMRFHPEPGAVSGLWNTLYGIHVGSIALVSRPSGQALSDLTAAAPPRVLVSLDPNIRLTIEPHVERWRQAVDRFRRHAHLIKVSDEDICSLFGREVQVDQIAVAWLEHRCQLVAVTRGARGVSLFSRKGRVDIDAVPVTVGDTVGAGDCFQAALLAHLAETRHASPAELAALSLPDLDRMGRFAAAAAAITCRHRGPEFPYRKALRQPWD